MDGPLQEEDGIKHAVHQAHQASINSNLNESFLVRILFGTPLGVVLEGSQKKTTHWGSLTWSQIHFATKSRTRTIRSTGLVS